MQNVGLMALHGMGNVGPGYANALFDSLRARLAERAAQVHFGSAYYKGILAPNETRVWDDMVGRATLRYHDLRRFLLFGFADAAGLENRKEEIGSVYEQAQAAIAATLLAAYRVNPAMRMLFVSHSLGCQVLSSYLYDAQKKRAGRPVAAGIWRAIDEWAVRELGRALTAGEEQFIRGDSCMGWVTTGCNIPIFVAAHKVMHVVPIDPPHTQFKWLNLYDPDDALGWPLQPLPGGYRVLVEDRAINASRGVVSFLFKSWNPWSHQEYWGDKEVQDVIEAMLRRLVA